MQIQIKDTLLSIYKRFQHHKKVREAQIMALHGGDPERISPEVFKNMSPEDLQAIEDFLNHRK